MIFTYRMLLILQRNYTFDGVYTVYTGETDSDKLGFITNFNGAE